MGLFSSCANIMAPTGGERDAKAPVLRSRSLPDSALHFKGGVIELTFDEFIQLKDAANQITITPLLNKPPKYSTHKRTVRIEIADSLLQDNTTYHILTGNAIQDLHEGNAYPNLNITFSTGAWFDSLRLQGKVLDAETGMPDTASWVVLYPESAPDSAILTLKPMYAIRSQQGRFQFENLPNRAFRIFALKDVNTNLRFDAPGERIGFQTDFVVPGDSTKTYVLRTFAEDLQKPDTASKKSGLQKKGSVSAPPASGPPTYSILTDTSDLKKRSLDLNEGLVLQFNQPILLDPTRIRLYQDEILDASALVQLDSTRQSIRIQTDWQQDAVYTCKLLNGFAQDSQKRSAINREFKFRTKRKSDYGFLTLLCDIKKAHRVQLMQNQKIVRERNMSDSTLSFQLLTPGSYTLRILHDVNENGRWDTGSFQNKQQPEEMELIPGEILIKANWEQKLTIRPKPRLKK